LDDVGVCLVVVVVVVVVVVCVREREKELNARMGIRRGSYAVFFVAFGFRFLSRICRFWNTLDNI
jgi:hypothetical protein